MHKYEIEITDTFGGEANYCWVRRHSFTMPDMTYYGYDGGMRNYIKASKTYRRELVKRAKALAGWTGARCEVAEYGDTVEIRPRGAALVAFVTFKEGE